LCQLIYREPARVQQRLQQLRHQKRISRTKQWRSPVGLHRLSEYLSFTLNVLRLLKAPWYLPSIAIYGLHWASLYTSQWLQKTPSQPEWRKILTVAPKWKRVTLSRTCVQLTSLVPAKISSLSETSGNVEILWSLWWKIWPGGKIASQSTCSRCVKLRLLSTPSYPSTWLIESILPTTTTEKRNKLSFCPLASSASLIS